MKLIDYCENNYESRAKCAEALGVSVYQFNNAVARKAEVMQLFSGKWMLINKYNKIFDS